MYPWSHEAIHVDARFANVVQVVINNVNNFTLMGKMINTKYLHIMWSPCMPHNALTSWFRTLENLIG